MKAASEVHVRDAGAGAWSATIRRTGRSSLDVPMFVEFDQKIDPSAVLAHVKVDGQRIRTRAGRARSTAPRSEGQDAGAAHAQRRATRRVAKALTDARGARRPLASRFARPSRFRPTRRSTSRFRPARRRRRARTRPRRRRRSRSGPIRRSRSKRRLQLRGECRPGMPFVIRFNNPLDVDKFDEQRSSRSRRRSRTSRSSQSGNYLAIDRHDRSARTTYKRRGRGAARRRRSARRSATSERWRSTSAMPQPTFFGPAGMVVLDPAAKQPTLDFFTTNYEQLKVKLYQVDAGRLRRVRRLYMRNQWNHDHPPQHAGQEGVRSADQDRRRGRTSSSRPSLDLAPALCKRRARPRRRGGRAVAVEGALRAAAA